MRALLDSAVLWCDVVLKALLDSAVLWCHVVLKLWVAVDYTIRIGTCSFHGTLRRTTQAGLISPMGGWYAGNVYTTLYSDLTVSDSQGGDPSLHLLVL